LFLAIPVASATELDTTVQETVKVAASRARVYFPGLNGLRFLAALSVVVVHINQFKDYFGTSLPLFLPKFLLNGNDAVTLFFVLSGFLITYLLFVEHQQTGKISVRSFYVRRILRIWPLYYLIVLIGFVGIPLVIHLIHFQGYYESLSPKYLDRLMIHLLFLPNIVGFFVRPNLTLAHLWTIGIEEQFYLIWPPLLRKFIRHPLLILFGIIVFKILIFHFDNMIVVDKNYALWFRSFISVLANFRVESMAIGGIGAYLWFYQKQAILNIVFHPLVEKIILGIMIANVLVFSGNGITVYPDNLYLSVLYALFILNIACNPKSTIKLENRYFHELGKYSYGIYMYHPAIAYLALVALSYTRLWEMGYFIYNLVLYALVIGGTVGVSAWSYERIEMRFLRLKDRFATIQTGGS
jgi:peptidoglycan/LPS O-acetylase OafA/YrhL